MGLLSFVMAKALGVPTPAERFQQKMSEFAELNSLTHIQTKERYKIDRCPMDKRFYVHTLFSLAKKGGLIVHVVIEYNENLDSLRGGVIDKSTFDMHRLFAREHRAGDQQGLSCLFLTVTSKASTYEKLIDTY